MITGALAASYYGQPRTTMDLDVAIRASDALNPKLRDALSKAALKVDSRRLADIVRSGYDVVTLRDRRSPHGLDLILIKGRLQRRRGSILGMKTYYQRPDDLILAKLRMIKATVPPDRASKDREDIRAILRFTKVSLDAIKKYARKQGTLVLLEELLRTG